MIIVHEIYSSEDILKKYKELFESDARDIDFNSFLKDNSYDIIKNSNTFDESFYIENYPDTVELDLDSIQHYLEYGVFENCNPNSFFNTKEYLLFIFCYIMVELYLLKFLKKSIKILFLQIFFLILCKHLITKFQ